MNNEYEQGLSRSDFRTMLVYQVGFSKEMLNWYYNTCCLEFKMKYTFNNKIDMKHRNISFPGNSMSRPKVMHLQASKIRQQQMSFLKTISCNDIIVYSSINIYRQMLIF